MIRNETHWPQGLCAVLSTPFDSVGLVDESSLERQVRFYLDHGATSVMALGVMGEGPALDRDESLDVVRTVARAAGPEIPMVVGAVGMARDGASEFGAMAVEAGASALMMTAPTEAADSATALADHFGAISAASGAAIVLLDCPAIAPKLSVERLVGFARQLDAFCAIKLEDNPSHLKIGELKGELGGRLAIFGANGAVLCLHELERGADGFMTGYAYPEHLTELIEIHGSGDRERASEAYARYLPLITYCWQPGIGLALRKELLVHRGVIASSYVRAPFESVDPQTRAELLRVAERLEQHCR